MRKLIIAILAITVVSAGIFTISRMNTVSTTKPPGSAGTYVALGDSVAAGAGLPTYSDASACNRTDEAYPSVFARTNGYKLTNLTCSGATIDAGIKGSQTVNNKILPSQLDELFARVNTPNIITLTIGANDIGWAQYLECYVNDCGPEVASQLPSSLASLDQNMSGVLDQMRLKYAANPPKVFVTGYYQAVPRDGATCSDTAGLSKVEAGVIYDVFEQLNNRIKDVISRYDFVMFVPIDYTGHELCSRTPWIQGLSEKAPFHPNEAGQEAIAKQLASAIQSKQR